MARTSRLLAGIVVLAGALAIGVAVLPRFEAAASSNAGPAPAPVSTLPASLTDAEFWQFVTRHSEDSGSFPRENLTSNEMLFQYVIPDLLKRATAGGVYLGVGPEQNFTYMAALKPRMAIIFDIRRGNLDVQLMYKALFELGADRADFVSMLFSRPRPSGLGAQSSVSDLFAAFARVPASSAMHAKNLRAIEDRLTKTHNFALTREDLEWIEYVFDTFYREGYSVRPSPTYADLMTATDEAGVHRSYLAAESNYAWLKDLETRNMVVPLVGDFAGKKAIRDVASYLKAHGATVSAFYLSNVEDYLYQEKWGAFCRNVAALPLDGSSTFIRSSSRGGRRPGAFGGFRGYPGGFVSSLGSMREETQACR